MKNNKGEGFTILCNTCGAKIVLRDAEIANRDSAIMVHSDMFKGLIMRCNQCHQGYTEDGWGC